MKHNDWLSVVISLSVLAALFAYAKQHSEDERKERVLIQHNRNKQCMFDATCSDQTAEFDSFMSDRIIRSPTGRYFYKGVMCDGACDWEVKGYQWAKANGVTQNAACHAMSPAFNNGCLVGVRERINEINPPSIDDLVNGTDGN